MRWIKQPIAPDSPDSVRSFTITHPFHPLNGRRFEVLETRFCWREERIYVIDGDGVMQRLRVTWTILETPSFAGVSSCPPPAVHRISGR